MNQHKYMKTPLSQAAAFAFVYLAAKTIIILLLSELFLLASEDKEEYHKLDWLKDIILSLLTALVLFVFALVLFRKNAKNINALLESERRAMAGTLSLAVIHDFNNLLTIARGSFDMINHQGREFSDKDRRYLSQLSRTLDNLYLLSNRIKKAGKMSTAEEIRPVDLHSLVEGAIKLLYSHSKLKMCRLEFNQKAASKVLANPSMLQDAVINLVINAADATDGKGQICVSVDRIENKAIIKVEDNGPGIPPEMRGQVFETYYSTKKEGTGLGLSSVMACAYAHKGRVRINNSRLGGAEIILSLPVIQPEIRE